MFYEMCIYRDSSEFNQDARRRNSAVKNDTPAPAERLWWNVEQVMPMEKGILLVLWSRPEPFKNR